MKTRRLFMSPSLPQILIILAIVLLIFGPKRIPGIGRSLGQALRGFKKGVTGEDEGDKAYQNQNDNSGNKNE